MKYLLLTTLILTVGCEQIRSTADKVLADEPDQAEVETAAVQDDPQEAQPIPATSVGWVGAKTTVASLGDPTTPGRWMQTPLVKTEFTGRVVVPRTGAQAYITLVPAGGPEGGGSRLSLDAMRALLLPFDELVELEVYSN